MANASKDQNGVSTLLATLDTDGSTTVKVCADAPTHSLCVEDGTTGSDNGPVNATRDGNYVSSLLAVSSADGVTPVVVYADANGMLLVDSN